MLLILPNLVTWAYAFSLGGVRSLLTGYSFSTGELWHPRSSNETFQVCSQQNKTIRCQVFWRASKAIPPIVGFTEEAVILRKVDGVWFEEWVKHHLLTTYIFAWSREWSWLIHTSTWLASWGMSSSQTIHRWPHSRYYVIPQTKHLICEPGMIVL